jgi:hypothetical protein
VTARAMTAGVGGRVDLSCTASEMKRRASTWV